MEAIMNHTVKPTTRVTAPSPRVTAFGSRPLIEGEDAAAYDAHLARVVADLMPFDYIQERLAEDFAYIDWELLRLRRLTDQFFADRTHARLRNDLRVLVPSRDIPKARTSPGLDPAIFEFPPPKDTSAAQLARAFRRRKPKAIRRVTNLLARDGRSMESVAANAFAQSLDTFATMQQMTAVFESCRTGLLRELDRRRALPGDQRPVVTQPADQTSSETQ
jgi:hypothetical protein